jgi:signal peptidase I
VIRIVCVGIFAYLLFGHVLIPFRIKGHSMEPTYQNGQFNFCWKFRYLFSKPQRGEVVVVRFSGQKVMLLKRIVALEGDEVQFRNGKLFVNRKEMDETYIRYPCNWNLPPRRVEASSVYVIGDNRDGPIENHFFGQTSILRILGTPLW